MGGAFFVQIDEVTLVVERDSFPIEVDGFLGAIIGLVDHGVACVGVLVGADVGGYGAVRAEFQQTGRCAVRTADIQNQIAVNVDPHVIVTGEEELDGDPGVGIIICNDLTVLCKRKVKLQLGAKAVVVLARPDVGNCLVKREEAVGVFNA